MFNLTPWEVRVAEGSVPNWSDINKFGRNTAVAQTVTADIWDGGLTGGTLTWLAPTAARIHTIGSNSASDDVGGVGATTVIVSYLPDWNTAETTETVSGNLNADTGTGIPMNNAAVMINRMKVVPQSTSTTANVGTIKATAAVDGTVTSQINPGVGQTGQAIFGIPSTQSLYLKNAYGDIIKPGGSAGSISFTLFVNPNPNVQTLAYITKHTLGTISTASSGLIVPYDVLKRFDGPLILKITGTSTVNSLDVSAGFNGYLHSFAM